MPKHLSLSLDKSEPLELPVGDWVTLAFDVSFPKSDTEKESGRFLSFLRGKAEFALMLSVTLADLPAGVDGLIRLYQVDQGGRVVKTHPLDEWQASSGLTYLSHVCVGTVDEGNRLSAEIVQFGKSAGTIAECSLQVLYWPQNRTYEAIGTVG